MRRLAHLAASAALALALAGCAARPAASPPSPAPPTFVITTQPEGPPVMR